MSIGELLDRTFSLYRRHFWLFIGIMVMPQLFVLAARLMLAAGMSLIQSGGAGGVTKAPAAFGASLILAFFLMTFVFWAMYALAQAATVSAISRIYTGGRIGVHEAYAQVKGRFLRVLGVLIVVGFLVMAGFILCLVPGILLMLRYAVVMPAALIEDLGVSDSMKRSAKLTEGRWGEAFLVFLLFVVINWVAEGLFTYPFAFLQLFVAAKGQDPYWIPVMMYVGQFIGGVLAGPLLVIALSLFYYDCRIRKEALDLQMMLSALDQPGPAAPPIPPSAG
jgi:hypothetical protein